jgi:hypothetical protein
LEIFLEILENGTQEGAIQARQKNAWNLETTAIKWTLDKQYFLVKIYGTRN